MSLGRETDVVLTQMMTQPTPALLEDVYKNRNNDDINNNNKKKEKTKNNKNSS